MPRSTRHRTDLRLAEIAHRQHGVVTRSQLLDAGMGSDAIDWRVVTGRLHRLHRGVYAVGHGRLCEHAWWLAGVLAAGPNAFLSHASAAALWRLRPAADEPVHVTVASRSHRAHPGLTVHRSSTLGRHAVTRHVDVPVTTPARTLVDVADALSAHQLQRALGEGYALRIVDRPKLAKAIAAAGPRRGAGRLAALLDEHALDSTLTRSALEERFLDLCRGAKLPIPRVNAGVESLTVDFFWPARGLIAETDGRRYHGHDVAFERDRLRDQRLLGAGYRVVRFTYRQVVRSPESVVATLRKLLAADESGDMVAVRSRAWP